jgi:predicted nucleotidyltransferase
VDEEVAVMVEQGQEELYARVVGMLREEFGKGLLGVLVTGSRVHGRPGPTSDLDVHVVIAASRRQRRNVVLDGVEVELFVNPPFQCRRYFADGRGHDPHMFAFGQVVYDPQGVMRELQAEARAIWEKGPAPLDQRLIWMERYFPADLLRDLEDAGEDEATATVLIAAVAERLLTTHYRLHGRWAVKAKRRLSDLEGWDPRAAALARRALTCGPLLARREAAAELAAHVLQPIGGVMPVEWRTEWEELQP